MVQTPTAADIIAQLALQPHPEGGYYRETFRDPRLDANGRSLSTAIYFLLARNERSHWHRIDAVEVWHYYAGSALALQIAGDGGRCSVRLGPSPPAKCRRQSCLRRRGRPPKAPATGPWWAAVSRRVSISRHSSWPNRTGSLLAEKCRSGIGWVRGRKALTSVPHSDGGRHAQHNRHYRYCGLAEH